MEVRKLIIFAKQPRFGQVKTRLAKSIGDTHALEVYQTLLSLTGSITKNLNAQKIVYWDEIPLTPNSCFKEEFQNMEQTTGDLGKKMEVAFQTEFDQSNCKTLIIGTDCPYLTDKIFEDAYLALDHSDFVIGPATDGGYYLLGMKKFNPIVFQNIHWSTETVLSETIRKIIENHFTYTLIQELNDIDTENDWLEWQQMN
ncbi:TIGR04282 family arsenosugar biosynthesis glycosyltransferase [Leptospira sp. WS39.C2]